MKFDLMKRMTIIVVLVVLVTAVASARPEAGDGATQTIPRLRQEEAQRTAAPVLQPKGATGPAWYIVQLQDEPLATYRGGIAGMAATNPAARGEVGLDAESRASRAYLAHIEARQAALLTAVEQNLGRSVEVAHQYRYALNGVAMELTPAEAAVVAKLPHVRRLQRNFYRQLLTDYGPEWIGADAIWDGSALGPENRGEGIIVGVIDSGINMDHPSFADVGGDGYDHTNPLGAGNYRGWCDPSHSNYDPSLTCNDKLIGVYSFTDSGNDPEDDDGHGSHTAATAAGNVVTATLDVSANIDVSPTLTIPTQNSYVYTATISGVAPHANIIAYDACADEGCPLTDLLAAIDRTVADQVDVINYSIGGDAINPWGDMDALAFLNAVDAGIVPVTSAGNDGPGPATVGSPANAPWVLTVGAGTHNRAFPNALVDMAGGGTAPPTNMTGAGLSQAYGPAPIVYAGNYGDAQCLAPFAPDTFSGQIVVCDRGEIARVEKGVNVLAGGAGGYVLANSSPGQTLNSDAHALPAVHISYDDGQTLKSWLTSGSGHMATIGGTAVDVANGNADIMAGFSSRGPNAAVPGVIKPDVSAPGVDILAAYKSGGTNDTVNYVDEFNVISGTSMSSPHVAGAAVLLKAVRPNWTSAQIQSALMATAISSSTLKEDGTTAADPFDVGGGRVQVDQAARAGFILDEAGFAFADANPALGGDPTTLNIASLGHGQCIIVCRWTRTISNTVNADVDWNTSVVETGGMSLTVEPGSFTLGAYATQVVTVTADMSGTASDDWIFGQVNFTSSEPLPDAHFPVAVLPTSALLPDQIDIDAQRDAGSQLVEALQTAEITDLDSAFSGLVEATLTTEMVAQDSDNSTPYDDVGDGAFHVMVDVPAGTQRLVAEVTASQAPDVDLFWGWDSNGNGTPEASEEIGSSSLASYKEYLNLNNPPAGTYWVLVHNWEASAAGAMDQVTLATAVVPDTDAGNMSVGGPTSVPAGTPFDIRLYWDAPAMEVGDRWYGVLTLGTDSSSPGDIGTVPVNVRRVQDDVVKTASRSVAAPGDTFTYAITVQPKTVQEAVTYVLSDTIPSGVTYVPGSATATKGTVQVTGNQLTWSGTVQPPAFTYQLSTSDSDPACRTPVGGYLDLEAPPLNFSPEPGFSGDDIAFDFGDSPEIYGVPGGVLVYTSNGYATRSPWRSAINQDLPDPLAPNDLIAFLWRDMELVYDESTNRGMTAARATDDSWRVVEFDDIEVYGDPDQRLDMEIFTYFEPTDDAPEFIVAYDNVDLTSSVGTVGVENVDGSRAVQLAYNDFTPSDGLLVCFDWTEDVELVQITYQVTVDTDTPPDTMVTNTVVQQSDNPGSKIASTSMTVRIGYETRLPIIFKGQ